MEYFIKSWLYIGLALLPLFGCGPQNSGSEESQTAGRIVVKGEDVAIRMIRRESQSFMALYSKSAIAVDEGGSKAAIADLNEGRIRIAVMNRPITSAEDSIIKANGGLAKEYKIAYDGLAVIVNSKNKIQRLDFEQLSGIFSGKITSWRRLGGNIENLVPVIPGPNMGHYEYFQQLVLNGGEYAAKTYPCTTTAQIVELVKTHPSAIGLVSMGALYRNWDVWPPIKETGLKALEIAQVKESGYFYPNQKTVYEGNYPLSHPLYMYVNDVLENTYSQGMSSLAHGFITYISSAEGQKIAAQQGYVPATMPVTIKK
ncbi:MAG: PstS family phosphate ABC transporter substrate-binding protein [Candidatus Edwardsbacteria bacterium]|nr:PstS family phosphate ABC transporter substrate-binding protein [Candidatus Edwardsbacteria bacterium]MBU1576470.1 PstS family phosphate ABC transporter substrate-binding protein [Candidatus Edwardsbacteria bacterium]MBU2464471.1 PstS family phosphate ABC transporter substrate-binding protein [Candidatus Edwardsbacteria bacterium]MBU2594543.1 PstS family phosphate ABC transporter substrate-binding protein [Candidatus Edwardsbacteria bacterium]